MPKFRIKLKAAHDAKGLTAYRVAQETGVTQATVRKYANQDVEATTIRSVVVKLATFYGVDWRDPSVVEVIPETKNTTPTP